MDLLSLSLVRLTRHLPWFPHLLVIIPTTLLSKVPNQWLLALFLLLHLLGLLLNVCHGLPRLSQSHLTAGSLQLLARGGQRLALPPEFIPEDVLAEGEMADDQHMIGLSKMVEVLGAMSQDSRVVPIGASMSVLLVDCSEEIVSHMRKEEIAEDFVIRFSLEDPEAFPLPSAIVAAAFDWLREEVGAERAALYSPEVTAESGGETPQTRGRRPKMAARPDGVLPSEKPKPKPKKQTNASLASQLDTVAQTLQSLLARQDQLEERRV